MQDINSKGYRRTLHELLNHEYGCSTSDKVEQEMLVIPDKPAFATVLDHSQQPMPEQKHACLIDSNHQLLVTPVSEVHDTGIATSSM